MIHFESIITNGYVNIPTIEEFKSKGWTFLATLPAKMVHPHAMDTDKITIFSKYES